MNTDLCPKCGTSWDNGDILETFQKMRAAGDDFYKDKTDAELVDIASAYGWSKEQPVRFRRLIGIELPYDHPEHYDGVSYYQCPDCSAQFPVRS